MYRIARSLPLSCCGAAVIAAAASSHAARPAALDPDEVVRFLNQATFGASSADVQRVLDLGSYPAWIDEQLGLPATLHEPRTRELALRMCADSGVSSFGELDGSYGLGRINAWWDATLHGPDALRQRVAFALSEILVVSEKGNLANSQYGLASYYDVLVRGAFGNYRDMLEEVTLHPMMGRYLSMLRNERADPANNIYPDENFARELLQLFSIGVVELSPDGTPVLVGGATQPTYGQAEIKEFARVFTGWSFENIPWNEWTGLGATTLPMVAFPEYHDFGAKTLLGGAQSPAGLSPLADVQAALDNVFAHSNLGPFLARQLIQRLTTSNPSSGYVQRVAAAFDDDGSGQRGSLAAVVRAILLDPEARQGTAAVAHFGKLREPLLRLSHLRRAFNAQPVTRIGDYWGAGPCGQPSYDVWPVPSIVDVQFGQDVLSAKSVFNFFLPSYSAPGPLGDAGLVGPEFGIANESTLPGAANLIDWELHNEPVPGNTWTSIDTALEEQILMTLGVDALLDHLDRLLLAGRMSPGLRLVLRDHLTTPGIWQWVLEVRSKVRDGILLIAASPEYLIQK